MAILLVSNLQGQNQGVNYQAVARENNGDILSNTAVNLRFLIKSDSPDGTTVYQETNSVSTNSYGLINLVIGEGSTEIGDFGDIEWASSNHYLIVELNGLNIDTTIFSAVPYSKVATQMQLPNLLDVSNTEPLVNQYLGWDGNVWIPTTLSPDDADSDPTNELQSFSLEGSILRLSHSVDSVVLPSSPWNVNGSNLVYNSGNVGIGDKLEIAGSDGDIVFSDDQGSLRFANVDGESAPMIQLFQNGTKNATRMFVGHSPSFPSWGIEYNDTTDAFTWIGDNIPVLHVGISGQQRVGVGTRTPEAKLHVSTNSATGYGQLKLTETQFDYSRITMNNNIHENFWDLAARTDTILANAQFNVYHSNGGNIFSVNARGRVGINDSSPNYTFEVNGKGSTRILNLYNNWPTTTSTTYNYGVRSNLSQAANTGFPRLYCIYGITTDSDAYLSYGLYGYASGASSFNYGVYAYAPTSGGYAGYFNGNVYTTGAYQASDAKLKSNIRSYSDGLEKILAMRPTAYNYNVKEYDRMNLPEGARYGFVSQDIKEILPNLVKKSFHPYEAEEVKLSGEQGVWFEAVNYTGFIPIIVSAIQEQQLIINKKETEIIELSEQVKELENRLLHLEKLIIK